MSASSSAPAPRARSRSRSPTVNTAKNLPSIPEDAEPSSAACADHHNHNHIHSDPPSPPPYDDHDSERAALIREHLHRVFELVNVDQQSLHHQHHHQHQQSLQLHHHHQHQQSLLHHHHQQQRPLHHRVRHNLDPECHGARASEFYQAARRRQQAQVLGLLLFGVFFFSCVGLFVFLVVVGVRGRYRAAAAEWERRRRCFLGRGTGPHCQGPGPRGQW